MTAPSERVRRAGPNPAAPGRTEGALSCSAPMNGAVFHLRGGRPGDTRPPLLAVNGVNTPAPNALSDFGSAMSRLTGRNVDVVYNASSPGTMSQRAAPFAVAPLALAGASGVQAAADLASQQARRDLRNPPAATQLAIQVTNQLRSTTGRVDVVAYSQGGAIAAAAMQQLRRHVSPQDLARVHVLGIGAAVRTSDFPRGVHFAAIAHPSDPIPAVFGDGGSTQRGLERASGAGQHVNYFGRDERYGTGRAEAPDPQLGSRLSRWQSGAERLPPMVDRH